MTVTPTENGVRISDEATKATVEILNFGATITSWRILDQELLFLSKGSKLDGSRAVRGGIPLVFPRFGPPKGDHPATDSLPQHGFARSSTWELLGEVDENTVQFGLGPENLSEEYRKAWNYDFTLLYTVKLGKEALELSLEVENPGSEQFDFNVLFHTYFEVPEVEKVSVEGLNGLKYFNKVEGQFVTKEDKPVTFHGEVDRVYEATPSQIAVDYDGKPIYEVQTENLKDTVVWNPWEKGANSMSDFSPKEDFHKMVCVESGSVAEFVKLAPSKSWKATVTLKSLL